MKQNLGHFPKESNVCNCTNIRRASRALTQFYDECLSPSGLTVTRMGMLHQIMGLKHPGISELAAAFRIDRTTMNRNLKALLADGLVILQAGRDARKKEVQLTELGTAKLQQAYGLWCQAQQDLEDYLGREELQQLRGSLAKLEALVP